jgi:hypothetical protein
MLCAHPHASTRRFVPERPALPLGCVLWYGACNAPGLRRARILAGGSASAYPGGNAFPSVSEFEQWFVDEAGGDFQLKATAPAVARGAGADIARVQEAWKASQAGVSGTLRERPDRVKPERGKE